MPLPMHVVALIFTIVVSVSIVSSKIKQNHYDVKLGESPTGNIVESRAVKFQFQCIFLCNQRDCCGAAAVTMTTDGDVVCDLYHEGGERVFKPGTNTLGKPAILLDMLHLISEEKRRGGILLLLLLVQFA